MEETKYDWGGVASADEPLKHKTVITVAPRPCDVPPRIMDGKTHSVYPIYPTLPKRPKKPSSAQQLVDYFSTRKK